MEAFLSVFSDSLLSIMFLLFHHHFESRHENPPGYDSCSELIEHIFIDVVGKIKPFTLSLQVSLMETKWFLGLFRASSRCFLIILTPLVLFP